MENKNVKWEYKIIEMDALYSSKDIINIHIACSRKTYIEKLLNEIGDEGWEVCGYEYGNYLLKRVKQE